MTRSTAQIEETMTLRLAGDDRAPSRARHAFDSLDGIIDERGIRSDIDLLVSELVTNSIRHGGGSPHTLIRIEAAVAQEVVRVEVADEGTGFDPTEAQREREVGGYGLKLVDKIADRWGAERERRTRVWFEIHCGPREDAARGAAERPSEKRFARRGHG